MNEKWIAALGLALALSMASVGWAQDRAAQLEERVAETKARLNLTDEQIERITPILEASFEARLAVLEKHGIDLEDRSRPQEKLGFSGLRALGKDMKQVRQDTLDELSSVLSEQQIEEYKKIQSERKAELRKQLRERRS